MIVVLFHNCPPDLGRTFVLEISTDKKFACLNTNDVAHMDVARFDLEEKQDDDLIAFCVCSSWILFQLVFVRKLSSHMLLHFRICS